MKHIRKFNNLLKENSKYQESPIVFVGAHSKGVIEYGNDGEEIVGPSEFLSDLHTFYDSNSRL